MDWMDELIAEGKAQKRKPGKDKSPRVQHAVVAKPKAPPLHHTPAPGERPVRTVTYVVVQHCQECGGTLHAIGAELTVLRNPRTHGERTVQGHPTGYGAGELPHQVEYLDQTVTACPSCLHLTKSIMELNTTKLLLGSATVQGRLL